MNKVINQALSVANNYICTGQRDKARTTISMLKSLLPVHPAYKFFDDDKPCEELFGKKWSGEDLNGKSLEIFCDHGMGDTIQMLRYIKSLKKSYDVFITLNSLICDPLQRFFDNQDFVDVFGGHHKCDYHVNVMELPKLYHGYGMWDHILKGDISIPPQPELFVQDVDFIFHGFGLKCLSNPHNSLFDEKSVNPEIFKELNAVSLEPNGEWASFTECGDIADLASIIKKLPLVVSVDTLTLHLAGSLSVPTIGLLCYNADPRWGKDEITPWYPSVKLCRQDQSGSWESAISYVREEVACLKKN